MRGRYAPSPTGHLHLGNARTALLAWLQVRAAGGTFVMRVEDLDPARSRPELESEQLADLRWLGLDWDEGPDVGGPHGPYRQSERAEGHAQWADRLDTFPCSCTRREVREATLAPHGAEPIYPGTCDRGPTRPGGARSLRWRTPPGRVAFADDVWGAVEQDVRGEVGAFVLRRADGVWGYQLAVVADDAAMGITHVLRGADLLGSTARQIHLQRTLGLATPRYCHVPLLVGEDGGKLSKRHGARALVELREAGVDPRRVVAALGRSVGLVGVEVGWVSAGELVGGFGVEALGRESSWVEENWMEVGCGGGGRGGRGS
ncbi:MAG: tRNA glutamyl-Q(34) synthetase GluQRS [Nannocystaceae bacterium]